MELNTNLWGRENIILANQRQIQGGNVPKDFTLRFGNFILGKKYRKAIAFTTKMVILLITTLATWSVYQSGNTLANMQRKTGKTLNMLNAIWSCLIKYAPKRQNGTEAKLASNGIVNTQKSKSEPKRNLFARIAVKLLNRLCQMPCFVVKSVENNTVESTQELATSLNVSIVEKNLPAQKSSKVSLKKGFVQEAAQTETGQKVYNITVEKDGCYYANGVLVSNCDALTGTVEKRKKRGKQDVAGFFGY